MAVTIGPTNITFNDGTLLGSRTYPDYAGSYIIYNSTTATVGSTFAYNGGTYRTMGPNLAIRVS